MDHLFLENTCFGQDLISAFVLRNTFGPTQRQSISVDRVRAHHYLRPLASRFSVSTIARLVRNSATTGSAGLTHTPMHTHTH